MEIRVEIPDHVLVRKYGHMMPWVTSEDRIMPVVRQFDEAGRPDIQYYSFRNIKKGGLYFPFKREFERRKIEEMRCFYTGSQLHITDATLFFSNNWSSLPWAATKEHVAARRGNQPQKVNTLGNITPCAYFINRMMSHMPLAMKLFERDRLKEIEFDRETMGMETARFVRSFIIEKIERPFWFEGNYPWFAHVYVGTKANEAVREFSRILREFEDDFLSLDWQTQREYLRQPLKLDLRDLARRILGVG